MSNTIAREPGLILADIIQHEMALTPSQVMLYNQKFNIPTAANALLIVVGLVSSQPVSVASEFDFVTDHIEETQRVSMHELYQIDIMSADDTARRRRVEVIMALASTYGLGMCYANGIGIARVPTNFIDTSEIEATARLNRYTITIAVNAMYAKTQTVPHYDQFPTAVPWVDTKPTEV